MFLIFILYSRPPWLHSLCPNQGWCRWQHHSKHNISTYWPSVYQARHHIYKHKIWCVIVLVIVLLFLVQKIKAVYDSNPSRFKTLQHILEAEKEMHGSDWPKVGATLSLMWLKRSHFTSYNQIRKQLLCSRSQSCWLEFSLMVSDI